MAQLPGSFATPKAQYSLLSQLNYLSDEHGTYKKFIEKYPALAKSSYILMQEGSGNGVFTPTRQYRHWEPIGKTLPTFNVTTTTTAAAGLPITVTLTAGSHTSAGTLSPIAVGLVYENSTSRQEYRITAINQTVAGAHTATLQVINTTDVPLVTATVDYLLYRGRVLVEEGSDRGTTVQRQSVSISNEIRTIREDMSFTDRVLFEMTANPEGGYYYKSAQIDVQSQRFIATQEMDLMFGKTANGLGVNNSNGRGLIQDIETFGTSVGVVTTVDAAFWASLKRQIEAEGYSDTYDFLLDPELNIKIDDYLGTAYNNGAIIYMKPEESNKPMEVARNFRSYNIYNIKYNLLGYDYFNAAKMYGTPVSTATTLTGYYNYGVLIPQGEVPDAKTGAPVKRFAVRYSAESEGKPAIEMTTTGLYSPINQTTVAECVVTTITNKGIDTFGINGFLSVNLT